MTLVLPQWFYKLTDVDPEEFPHPGLTQNLTNLQDEISF